MPPSWSLCSTPQLQGASHNRFKTFSDSTLPTKQHLRPQWGMGLDLTPTYLSLGHAYCCTVHTGCPLRGCSPLLVMLFLSSTCNSLTTILHLVRDTPSVPPGSLPGKTSLGQIHSASLLLSAHTLTLVSSAGSVHRDPRRERASMLWSTIQGGKWKKNSHSFMGFFMWFFIFPDKSETFHCNSIYLELPPSLQAAHKGKRGLTVGCHPPTPAPNTHTAFQVYLLLTCYLLKVQAESDLFLKFLPTSFCLNNLSLKKEGRDS